MNNGLVVIEDTDRHRSLLETAGELAAGAEADLVLLSMTSTTEVTAQREAVSQVSKSHAAAYGTDTAEQRLTHVADRVAREGLVDADDVEYHVVPRIVDANREATTIVDVAEEYDCDHVFMIGKKRSRTGKAIFGSLAQSVMLAFDGQVTVELE